MNKVYVGNLDYGVTSEQLGDLFAEAGSIVDAVVISDRRTGRSKGFGFVEYATAEESQKAIELFNGKEHNGRELVVNEARPQKPRE